MCAQPGMPQATSAAPELSRRASRTMEHHRLQLGHLVDRRARALLADAAPLEAAVGHRVGAPERRRVDLDRAAVDLGREPQRALEIRGEEAGPKTIVAVVRERDRRPEELPAGDLERRVDVAEDARRDDGTVAFASCD